MWRKNDRREKRRISILVETNAESKSTDLIDYQILLRIETSHIKRTNVTIVIRSISLCSPDWPVDHVTLQALLSSMAYKSKKLVSSELR